MAVTPNYSWPVPVATDYVKDGWEAISDLGNAIDTTVAGLGSGLKLLNEQSFTAQGSVILDNVFSSTYDNYRVILSVTDISTANQLSFYFRSSVPADLTANNGYQSLAAYTATVTATGGGGNTIGYTMSASSATTKANLFTMDISTPLTTTGRKIFVGKHFGDTSSFSGQTIVDDFGGYNQTATAATGIKFYVSTGTFTGKIRLYGYQNS